MHFTPFTPDTYTHNRGRHSPEAGAGAGGGGGGESGGFAEAPIFADPNFSLRACDWVNQCLYSAATGAAAAAAAVNAAVAGAVGAKSEVVVVVAGGGGWGGAGAARGGGGPDAHPEMVEAVFTLMREWINELPVPSLRCARVCVLVSLYIYPDGKVCN